MKYWVCAKKTLQAKKDSREAEWAFLVWLKSLNRSFITPDYIMENRSKFAKSLGISKDRFDKLMTRCLDYGYIYMERDCYRLITTRSTLNDVLKESTKEYNTKALKKRNSKYIYTNVDIELNPEWTLQKFINELRVGLIRNIQARKTAQQGSKDAFRYVKSGTSTIGNPEDFGVGVRTIARKCGMSYSTIAKLECVRDKKPRFLGWVSRKVPDYKNEETKTVTVEYGKAVKEITYAGHVYNARNKVFEKRNTIYESGEYTYDVAMMLGRLKRLTQMTEDRKIYENRVKQVRKIYKHLYYTMKGKAHELYICGYFIPDLTNSNVEQMIKAIYR